MGKMKKQQQYWSKIESERNANSDVLKKHLRDSTRRGNFMEEAQKDLSYNDDYNTDRPQRTEASFERRPES